MAFGIYGLARVVIGSYAIRRGQVKRPPNLVIAIWAAWGAQLAVRALGQVLRRHQHRRQGLKFARPNSNARSGYLGLVGNFESVRESWRLRRHEDCGADCKLDRPRTVLTASALQRCVRNWEIS